MTDDKLTDSLTTTELARERSRDANERTLMAWIRTALALIGFGFGVGKVQDFLAMVDSGHLQDPIHGARIFGGTFIALGVLAVLMAIIQYRRRLNQIEQEVYVYRSAFPLSEVVAVSLLLIGLFGLVYLFL